VHDKRIFGVGCLVVWLVGCLVVWLVGCLVVCLFGCLFGWLLGCLVTVLGAQRAPAGWVVAYGLLSLFCCLCPLMPLFACLPMGSVGFA
jgi:hypothetical protein